MPITTAGANATLDGDFAYGNGTPATLYLALLTDLPPDDPTRAQLAEPVGNNYSALGVTNNATNWPAAAGGEKENGVRFDFADPSGPWGVIVGWAICSASTGGVVYRWDRLADPRNVDVGSEPHFDAGDIVIPGLTPSET